MSDNKLHLRIVTPDKTVVDKPVDAVGANGTEGAFTALPGHLPFLTDLKPGLLWYRGDGETRDLAVSGGFIEVKPDHVYVLADSADYLENIDIERAQRALKRATERLAKAKEDSLSAESGSLKEIDDINASLSRATTRLKLAARRIR